MPQRITLIGIDDVEIKVPKVKGNHRGNRISSTQFIVTNLAEVCKSVQELGPCSI
ncbi:MAG: hypothetical protein ACTS85_03755 [Arsenophonus sp. NC-PG7-MAG3]